jgi:peptidyl-tRNA hydrolase
VNLRLEEIKSLEDPLVMHIVVLQTSDLSAALLLAEVCRAVWGLEIKSDYKNTDQGQVWLDQGMRKVALRARGTAFEKVAQLDEAEKFGDVLITVPIRRSERDKKLAKLQVLTEPPSSESNSTEEREDCAVSESHIEFQVLESLSFGKQVAQIAHAANMLATDHSAAELLEMPLDVQFVSGLALTGDSVLVRDAGLTEIVSGTATVAARIVN